MSSSQNTLLIVILVVTALVLALCIVCVITVPSALREWAEGFGGSQMMETQGSVKPLQTALKRYISDHQEFPGNLDALKEYVDPKTLSAIKENFQYLPPKKDAPDDTVIAFSRDIPSFGNSSLRIEIHKDLSAWIVTKQKIPGEGTPARSPFSKG
jgi:hypothetical protein